MSIGYAASIEKQRQEDAKAKEVKTAKKTTKKSKVEEFD